jgi:DNA polymerase-3 subunit beta
MAPGKAPPLDHVLIKAIGGEATMESSNTRIHAVARLKADIIEEGAVLLPLKALAKVISAASKGPISISNEELVVQNCKVSLYGLNPGGFPARPAKNGGQSFAIDSQDLKIALSKVARSIADFDETYNLNGARLFKEGKLGGLVSTDTASMNVAFLDMECESFEALIPADGLAALRRLSGMVTLTAGERFLFAESENDWLAIRQFRGPFPDWRLAIPKSFTGEARASRTELLEALRRILTLKPKSALLDLESGTLAASNPELGSASESASLACEGETRALRFDPGRLADILAAMSGTMARLRFAKHAMVVTGDPKHIGALALISGEDDLS